MIERIPISEVKTPLPKWITKDPKRKSVYKTKCELCGVEFILMKLERPETRKSKGYTCSIKCRAELVSIVRPPPQHAIKARYARNYVERKKIKHE